MFKTRGGGSKAVWTMLKKTALLAKYGFPYILCTCLMFIIMKTRYLLELYHTSLLQSGASKICDLRYSIFSLARFPDCKKHFYMKNQFKLQIWTFRLQLFYDNSTIFGIIGILCTHIFGANFWISGMSIMGWFTTPAPGTPIPTPTVNYHKSYKPSPTPGQQIHRALTDGGDEMMATQCSIFSFLFSVFSFFWREGAWFCVRINRKSAASVCVSRTLSCWYESQTGQLVKPGKRWLFLRKLNMLARSLPLWF